MTKFLDPVIVIVAHPDDEVLGCGGTIAKLSNQNKSVHVVFLTDGVMSRAGSGATEIAERKAASYKAAEEIGISELIFLDFDDQKLDSVSLLDIVRPLEKIIKDIDPKTIFTHFYGDLNRDHQITCRAVLTACRPSVPMGVSALYAFETLSSTEWSIDTNGGFQPTTFVDISATLQKKVDALGHYQMEMHEPPHSRSIENVKTLSQKRGFEVGLVNAEAFVLLREIEADKV